MKYIVMTSGDTVIVKVNDETFQAPCTRGSAPVEMTEKQVSDLRKQGKRVEPFDDTPMPETVTVLKADLAAAMKTVIADADKKTGEELKKAVEAVAKAEPIEAKP